MEYTLTAEQRKKLMNALADVRDEEQFYIEVDLGATLTIVAVGSIRTDGYYEDDFYNGTGAWIETFRNAQVELKAILYNEEDNDAAEYDVDNDTKRAVEELLNKKAVA